MEADLSSSTLIAPDLGRRAAYLRFAGAQRLDRQRQRRNSR